MKRAVISLLTPLAVGLSLISCSSEPEFGMSYAPNSNGIVFTDKPDIYPVIQSRSWCIGDVYRRGVRRVMISQHTEANWGMITHSETCRDARYKFYIKFDAPKSRLLDNLAVHYPSSLDKTVDNGTVYFTHTDYWSGSDMIYLFIPDSSGSMYLIHQVNPSIKLPSQVPSKEQEKAMLMSIHAKLVD